MRHWESVSVAAAVLCNELNIVTWVILIFTKGNMPAITIDQATKFLTGSDMPTQRGGYHQLIVTVSRIP